MCGTMMERTAIGRAATGRRAVRRPMAASPAQGAVAEDARRGLSVAPQYARAELARKLAPHAEDPAEIEAVLDALERKAGCPPSVSLRASCIGARRARGGAHRAGAAPAWRGRRPGGRIARSASVHRARARAGGLAQALRRKAADRAAYAKQARFLASRGFAQDVIRRILGGAGDESRPGRRVGPGPQTPGPKRQVSGRRRQAYCAHHCGLTARTRGPSPPPRLFR